MKCCHGLKGNPPNFGPQRTMIARGGTKKETGAVKLRQTAPEITDIDGTNTPT
ncbi:hypothetical protein MnTg02_03426 [bacterium MnTg02]|nr:hypothetical protein MnTg02_03426 [bacterium MnTg02]